MTSTRPRVSHGPLIRDVATLHRRTGVTNPLTMRTIPDVVDGVGCRFVPAREQGYASNSFKVHGVGNGVPQR